jgi:Flp pilus assembly CpaE family ATPase
MDPSLVHVKEAKRLLERCRELCPEMNLEKLSVLISPIS